jgi:hypothetical protein
MPIVSDDDTFISQDPTHDFEEPVNNVKLTSITNDAIVSDSRWTPRMNLLTHAEGYLWTVNYYSQVTNKSSQLSAQQLSIDPTYQQYKKIHNLEMKVQSPLDSSQDEESKAMKVTGEAILASFIVPNDKDMFTADIGEGQTGVFVITTSTKLSIYKEACYKISYTLINTDSIRIQDLEDKVVENSYYHDKFVVLGRNPIITSDKHSVLLELSQTYTTLLKQYFKRFYSREYNTMIIPGQDYVTYDHYLVDFLLSQFTTYDTPEIKYVTKYNVSDDLFMQCDNLWTLIRNRDISYLNTAFTKAGLISTKSFSNVAVAHGIRFSNISNVVYPTDPVLSIDNITVKNNKILSTIVLKEADALLTGQNNVVVNSVNIRNISGVTSNIYTVTFDDYYVLSENFYKKTTTMSELEVIARDYIEGKSLDATQLLQSAKLYTKWGLLEQFYYTPILAVAIRSILYGESSL